MSTTTTPRRLRRLGGWGYEGEVFEPPLELLAWLEEHVGPATSQISDADIKLTGPEPRTLPPLPVATSSDLADRMFHARGQGLADIVRVRTGTLKALPDAVVRPTSRFEIEAIFAATRGSGVRLIPWGGGTSVTGGVNTPASDIPTMCIDLELLAELNDLDAESGLAVVGPGMTGPAIEAVLSEHGFTLGHFPQSWELATIGGWVATRSSGQESLHYGSIDDMAAGFEIISPAGRWRLPALPASAAGPDLRELVLGSEGRLGIITEITLRIRPKPLTEVVEAYLVPDIERGIDAVRAMVWNGVPLSMVRVSDAPETAVAMATGLGSSPLAPLVHAYLKLRRVASSGCLVLVGAVGSPERVSNTLAHASSVLGARKAVGLGRRPGRHWQRDRFRHPYLREALLDRGWATDTLETAVPWSKALEVRQRICEALENALAGHDERVAVLCHISHPYVDGTSLYFTFFFRTSADADETIERWATLKRTASDELVACGATISHHHGVGQWHAPWLGAEIGEPGQQVLELAARRMDPEGLLNPHVLLDPTDRLED